MANINIQDLIEVVARHSTWTEGKRFLLVPYHLIGARNLESAILGHYTFYIINDHGPAQAREGSHGIVFQPAAVQIVLEIERSWGAKRTVRISTVLVSAERTCGLRQKALAIAAEFLTCPEPALVAAVIPVFGEAVQPLDRTFYFKPSLEDHEAWRPERLAALSAVERVVHTHREAPAVLIQLRRMLRDRCARDPDPDPCCVLRHAAY